MDALNHSERLIADMTLDGRYRTFTELERIVGAISRAVHDGPEAANGEVTVWCSNDCLGDLKPSASRGLFTVI